MVSGVSGSSGQAVHRWGSWICEIVMVDMVGGWKYMEIV